MSQVINEASVTFRGFSNPVGPEKAVEILEHIEAYDPPASYDRLAPGVEEMTPATVGAHQIAWGDEKPETFDVTTGDANVF